MTYQVKDRYEVAEIGDEFLVMPRDEKASENPGVLVFNETGAFLWRVLEKGATLTQLSEKLCEQYGITMEQATTDVKELLQKMEESELLEHE